MVLKRTKEKGWKSQLITFEQNETLESLINQEQAKDGMSVMEDGAEKTPHSDTSNGGEMSMAKPPGALRYIQKTTPKNPQGRRRNGY